MTSARSTPTRRFLSLIASGSLMASAAGCSTALTTSSALHGRRGLVAAGDARGRAARPHPPEHSSYWKGNGASGQPSILVRLAEQRAYFYKGDMLVGVTGVSSGRKGHDTPVGTFKVLEKDPGHRSSEYGDYVDPLTQVVVKANVQNGKDPQPPGSVFLGAPMPHFLRLTGDGVGMHAGRLPGYPASHGCIRLPATMAENFFANAPLRTPVTVSP